MKRILALCLLLALLLSACGETVPSYEQPATSVPATNNLSEATEPSLQLPEISEPGTVLSLPKDESMLRPEKRIFADGDGVYYANSHLQRYDEEKDRMEICCFRANCTHMDENCGAWLNGDSSGLRFALREKVAFFLCSEENEYGEDLRLEFYTADLTSGVRRSYHQVVAGTGQEIFPGDLLICGNRALLSYAVGENYEGNRPQSKTQYILAFDLADGTMTTVMCREIEHDAIYDLWGMNESHLILAYHHGGGIRSYGDVNSGDIPTYGYDEYVRDVHRWVLLEYPIEENAKWSQQICASEAGSELELFSYSSFYGGKLYYLANSYLKVYDLSTHKNETLFYLPGIANLFCADGKVFYRTYAKEFFYYDLTTEQVVQYQKESLWEQFTILYETDDSFLGKNSIFNWLKIKKEDFYEENYDAAIAYP
ncbi:MAG: hypothetical protein IJ453_02660 [Oscillospiraceae bacterium]|nr:hypothetical protein [Oscillospiraceae bacterium]